jgi:hypothetical protein
MEVSVYKCGYNFHFYKEILYRYKYLDVLYLPQQILKPGLKNIL